MMAISAAAKKPLAKINARMMSVSQRINGLPSFAIEGGGHAGRDSPTTKRL